VRQAIAGEQGRLEKGQGHDPARRGPAHVGQHHAPDHGLHGKGQDRRERESRSEQRALEARGALRCHVLRAGYAGFVEKV